MRVKQNKDIDYKPFEEIYNYIKKKIKLTLQKKRRKNKSNIYNMQMNEQNQKLNYIIEQSFLLYNSIFKNYIKNFN